MLELLFLLLPVAAAYGWYMGRRSVQQDEQCKTNHLLQNYVIGVNFLLSNKQDKAVNLFLDTLKEDSSLLEAHFTLGNIFRSRGEVDHAIRIHQELINSTSLTYDQRLLAMQQLGRDYMAAGFYDRAEKIFGQLVNETNFCVSALQQLLIIYQVTSDWLNAIEVGKRLLNLGKKHLKMEIAHFYCELALQAIGNEDLERAINLLKCGDCIDHNSPRISIMMGRIYIAKKEYEKAVKHLQYVIEQDKELVSETLEMLESCYQQLSNPQEWKKYLCRCVEENTGSAAALYLVGILDKEESAEVVQNYITHQLQRHPTMRVFHRLMDFKLQEAEEGCVRESLIVLRDMVGELIKIRPHYRCHKCGFTSHIIYWHCPLCHAWSSIKPVRGLDGQ